MKEYSFFDDGQVAVACTRNDLFPLGAGGGPVDSIMRALQDCLDAICIPLTLNPDFAGIGVSPSYTRHKVC